MPIFSRQSHGAAVGVAIGLVVSACGSGGASTGGGNLSVLASIYPLAFVTDRIAGDDVGVENLTSPGTEPHHLELTGQQVGKISDADLVVYLSGFQPAVDEAIEQNGSENSLDVMSIVESLPEVGSHDHDDHEHHDDEEQHDQEQHDDLASDPHVWLDPTNLAAVADAVADDLAELAPERSSAFHERADMLADELADLDRQYEARLATCERRTFVTSHEAFGYLAHRYDLEMVGISGLSPDAEPSPARLAEVQQVVAEKGITTIFFERLVSPRVAQALADDLGIATDILDPIESLTDETADDDYFTVMRSNLEALVAANDCS